MKIYNKFGGNMKKNLLTILLIIAFINVFAYSFLEYDLGNRIHSTDARSRAMGGSGMAAGVNLFDAQINPANLYFLETNVNTQIGMGILKFDENRSIPMYNFFDSYIDDATYSSNINLFNDFSAGLSYKKSNDKMSISYAALFYPVMSFDAYYEEQVRNDYSSNEDLYPKIIAKNFKEGEGKLNSYSILFSTGYKINNESDLSAGIEAGMLNGRNKHKSEITWSEYAIEVAGINSLPDSLYKSNNDISGLNLKFGLNYKINARMNAGFIYQPKLVCKTDVTINGQKINKTPDYILPSTIGFGIAFSPRNPYKTNFQADLEFVKYSDIDKSYDDFLGFYTGVEHFVGKAVPLRLGFRYEVSATDKSMAMPTVCAGTSFYLAKNVRFDISGEFSKRTYDALDMFQDSYYANTALWNYIKPTDRGWENPDRVDETFAKIQTGITYTW